MGFLDKLFGKSEPQKPFVLPLDGGKRVVVDSAWSIVVPRGYYHSTDKRLLDDDCVLAVYSEVAGGASPKDPE